MKKRTSFLCLSLILTCTQSMANSYWVVGIDDGNQCQTQNGRLSVGDPDACVCIKKAPKDTRWKLKHDLSKCLPASEGDMTQSQCLNTIYMNQNYPTLNDQGCIASHLQRCHSTGDTKHCY